MSLLARRLQSINPAVVPPGPGPIVGVYGETIEAAGPLSFWRLAETSGDVAFDSIGANDGDYIGSPTLDQPSLNVDDNGSVLLAAASEQSVRVDAITSVFTGGAPVWTVEMWFKTTSTARAVAFGFGSSSTETSSFMFIGVNQNSGATGAGDHLAVRFRNTGSLDRVAAWNNTAFRDGNPHHVVVTRNGTDVRLYFDGVERATSTLGTTYTQTPDRTAIGAFRRGGDSLWFDGTVDDVSVYDVQLSAAQVSDHYDAGTV